MIATIVAILLLSCSGQRKNNVINVIDSNTHAKSSIDISSDNATITTDSINSKLILTRHSLCLLNELGSISCFGSNDCGQLGAMPSTGEMEWGHPTPAMKWKDVAIGSCHGCGISLEGKLYCWGRNYYGELGVGDNIERKSAIENTFLHEEIIDLTAGKDHTCAITKSGSLFCWGDNSKGQLGIKQVGADRPYVVKAEFKWREVRASSWSTCAINSNEKLFCWGDNHAFKLGDPDKSIIETPQKVSDDDWIDVSCGLYQTCALNKKREIMCCGDMIIETEGVAKKMEISILSSIEPNRQWKHVSVGIEHACAIDNNDSLYCWGSNLNNELGIKDNNYAIQATPSGFGKKWRDVAAGYSTTCAISEEDDLYCWGVNWGGMMGDIANSGDMPIRITIPK
jgi:alpha-tubulin suppressor-like RCC1 family protein